MSHRAGGTVQPLPPPAMASFLFPFHPILRGILDHLHISSFESTASKGMVAKIHWWYTSSTGAAKARVQVGSCFGGIVVLDTV